MTLAVRVPPKRPGYTKSKHIHGKWLNGGLRNRMGAFLGRSVPTMLWWIMADGQWLDDMAVRKCPKAYQNSLTLLLNEVHATTSP